ncbi:DNA glycosylase [Pholiota conissans]|uniref:DNA glycosylase n=1 Tax=Pholiota conissans TaxID=109636 RepID=A0A9P6CZQ4_9AGAR|nr:DNA glycosylase [Pholiota conissans]
MPAVRRSATRAAAAAAANSQAASNANVVPATQEPAKPIPKTNTSRKRRANAPLAKEAQKIPKQGSISDSAQATPQATVSSIVAFNAVGDGEDDFVPATLAFNFEEAKKHLINVDYRFEDLFSKMKCRPFEHLEQVHPFRALTTSILGQQISWLAARSITHRFIRLYDQSLPENPTDEVRKAITFFPSPSQVAATEIAVLRTAGLSGRKAEYIQDLASRFADGRLSTEKLLKADDEELARMLIEVRGIGRWTVDMFAIFSLRRPDILPVGDLGVQRGIVRWFLSLHSPAHSYNISPEKVGGTTATKKKAKGKSIAKDILPALADMDADDATVRESSVPPGDASVETEDLPSLPPTFTPSIKKTLDKVAPSASNVVPLPSGIDVALLKSRLSGKNKIKGAFLTPPEMAALTECWVPYRSIGVYYMWSLADATE